MENRVENPASWWIRALAAILDFIPGMIVSAILLILLFVYSLEVAFGVEGAGGAGDSGDGMDGMDMIILAGLVLLLGYIVWWLIALGKAQTPGKQIVGVRVVNADTGQPLNWGMMFLREFVIKGLLAGFILGFTFGIGVIAVLLNYLWPLWDDKNQAMHDKMVSSIVVRAR